jgi:hypothetical protein
VRKILQSLLGFLPTPKSVVGLVGYLLVALYPISLVLNVLSNVDLVAANVEWIEYVLRQWWGYPLFMIVGFAVLLYAGYKQQSRQTLHAAAHPQPETQPTTTTEHEKDVEQLKVELAETRKELAEAQQTIRSQRKAMEDDQGVVHWGQANAVDVGTLAANAESKRKIEELKAENERLRNQAASPEVSRQKRLCFHLADDLRGLHREFQDGERMLIAQLQEQEEANIPEKEREEVRRTKQLDLENKTQHKYHHGFSDRLEKLYEELEPDGWLGPNDEILFLNLRDPNDIKKVADRLDEVGHNLM